MSPPPESTLPATQRYRSKTVVVWLAVLGGTLGLHRFYLNGWRDPIGWLHPLPTLAGLIGLVRLDRLGQDDQLAWVLLPLLGLSISAAMLVAIVHALTSDARWDERRNPGLAPRETRWGPVLGAALALLLGATAFMSAVAFGLQKLFEVLL